MTTCVCLSPALITNAYTFVSVQTAAALDKKPGVCRNCQGIGAVLCELNFLILLLYSSSYMLLLREHVSAMLKSGNDSLFLFHVSA